MKEFFLKYNLECFTVVAALTIVAGLLGLFTLTPARGFILELLACGVLHEWEEKRFPGGFFEHMGRLWGWDMDAVDMRRPSAWVIVAWVLLAYIPLIFANVTALVLSLMILGVFEMIIHTAGKWIAQIKGPYVPGIVTAWIMGIVSVWAWVSYASIAPITALDVLGGILFFVAVMGFLQFNVQRSAGSSVPQMAAHMRQRFGR